MPHHAALDRHRSVDWCKRLLKQPPGPWPADWFNLQNIRTAFRELFAEACAADPPPTPYDWSDPGRHGGAPDLFRDQSRGIVICGGGWRFFPSLYVTVRMIRRTGCSLPIQIWYLGHNGEFDPRFAAALEPFDVGWVDANAVAERHPRRLLGGWEMKPFAVAYAPWREVFFFDADSYPLRDPESFLEDPRVHEAGAVFWPDQNPLGRETWQEFGLPYRNEPAFESGQLYIDKGRHWQALCATMFLNDFSDYTYHKVYGDKDTFHLGFRGTGHDYLIATPRPGWNTIAFVQMDLDGEPFIIHRTRDKFRFGEGLVDGAPVAGHENYMTRQFTFSILNPHDQAATEGQPADGKNLYVRSLPGESFAHAYADEIRSIMRPQGPRGETAGVPRIQQALGRVVAKRRQQKCARALLTHHRSASQFARVAVSELVRLKGRSMRGLSYGGGGDGDCTTEQAVRALDLAYCVANSTACPAFVELLDVFGDFRAVHVWRDPRDVVVSTYHSNKNWHLPNLPGVAAQREILNRVDLESGLEETIDWLDWLWKQLRHWPRPDERILEISFGDLTRQTPAALEAIARHFDLLLSPVESVDLAARLAFERFSGGRPRGVANEKHHFRKGVVGDWQNVFTERVSNYFDRRAGDLIERWGEPCYLQPT